MTLMQEEPAARRLLPGLWERLTLELATVFDAHGICAIAAREIARCTGCATLVGLADSFNQHYDVWISNRYGEVQQLRWNQATTSFGRLLAAGEAAWHSKYELPAQEVINSDLWRLPREGLLSVPLPFPRRELTIGPAGVLCLVDPRPDCLVEAADLQLLATHLTIYLDRAYLRQRIDQQEIEFAIVSDISYSITATLNLQHIFHQVADRVRRTINSETISIGLIEEDGDILFVDDLMGPLFRNLPPIRLGPNQGIAGWVATHGEALVVNDVPADKRFFSRVDEQSGFQTRSMLCIPLQVEQKVIGVLEAINKQKGHFDKNDLRLMQAIGGPLAAAIANASLHTDVLAEKRRIETIFASMAEGVVTINREGIITAVNESLLTLLRQEEDHLVGRPAAEVIETETGGLDDFLEQVFTADDEFPQLACDVSQGKDEYVPVLISGAPIDDEEGLANEAILVFSDLRQIREVERMRDDFFHNIIHELRTPLATILMYARLLREGKARDDKAKEDRFLGVIEQESDRLQRMVRQMLQMAKLEAREIQRSSERVDLGSVLAEILPPLADQATEKGLTFLQRLPTQDELEVIGNQETLYVIFKNLVENAIKFTLSGSVQVSAWRDNGVVAVEVKDNGIGIPTQALPNLFKRFYRAKTAVERGIAGSGLGLYMVKEGVEKHGGTIDVKSAEGKGTTFLVRLPVAAG
ncbi:MAG: ATP-binding protein [Chloroflexota bacterium]